jgi:Flp pilus assembly protein TadG
VRPSPTRRDDGSAVLEFVFLAVLVMVPLIYLIVAVATVQRSQLAVTQAAREAGRAFATSDSSSGAPARVGAAVRLALRDQGLGDDAAIRFVALGASCDSPPLTPGLSPGAAFTVCVTRRVSLPAIPHVLAGRGISTVGRYDLHVDDYRTVAP